MSLVELCAAARRHLPRSDGHASQYVEPLPGLGVLRHHRPTRLEAAVYDPILILVLEGRKETVLGTDAYPMGVGESLLVSHDLPVVARVTRAPYLALLFALQLDVLRDLFGQMDALHVPISPGRALAVQPCEARLSAALHRYLELASSPADAAVLGPLLVRELHYLVAMTPAGAMLRGLAHPSSHASSIARAIGRLRREFRSPIEIPDLARSVGMSTPSFHRHFKAITATSPLQYRKGLQLLEARRLLRAGACLVTEAAYEVGYESAAQFSRDYARRFGASPRNDLPTG